MDIGGGGPGGSDGVGLNPKTWDFLVKAIQSRRFTDIGTLAPLVEKLGPWAKTYGVTMFEDDASTGATAPHIHLQVGGP